MFELRGKTMAPEGRKRTAQNLPPVPLARAVLFVSNLLARVRRRVTPAPLLLLEMTSVSFFVSNGILAVARLGVADALRDGPRTAEEIADAIHVDRDMLSRVLTALSNAGVFDRDANGRFALNSISRCLVTGVPGSMNALLRMGGDPWHYKLWGELAEVVRTGIPAHERVLGMPVFDYLARHPEEANTFNQAMLDYSAQIIAASLAVHDLTGMRVVVDVGGGYGQFVTAVLDKYPEMRAVLFDLPHVVQKAREELEGHGVAARVEVIGGSFLDEVPRGGDVYVLMSVLHDWDDERAAAILTSCRRAMDDRAKLLIIEMVLPVDGTPYFGSVFDMEMLVLFHGGRERTLAQFRRLLEVAGLKLTRVSPTATAVYVLEAVPA